MWEVWRVVVIILEARNLVFLITVNMDQCPLLGAVLSIRQLLTYCLIIMVLLPTPLESPDSLLFVLLLLGRFLSVPSCWERGWWQVRKSDLSSLRSFSISLYSACGSSSYCPILIPTLLHPQCYPIPISFEFVRCALNFICLWFILTLHKWGPSVYLFSNTSFSLMPFMTLQKFKVLKVVTI